MNLNTIQRQIPFLRISVSYVPALLILRFFPGSAILLLILSVSLFLGLCVLAFFTRNGNGKVFLGHALLVMLFICGLTNYYMFTRFNTLPRANAKYFAIINSSPHNKGKYVALNCRIKTFIFDDTLHATNELVRINLPDSNTASLPLPGDSVIFSTTLHRIKNRQNPDEFDYAGYMALNRIHYTGFVKEENIRIVPDPDKYRVRRWAALAARHAIKAYREKGITGNELAVLSALTIGDRDYLDVQIKNDYARAGAMHVLAVSGLHIGILFLFINLLLWWRNNTRFFRLLRLFVTLGVIWFYAFLTGLSPSVMRAAVMFSFFQLAKTINRPTNSYNILLVSGLVILLVNPLELFKAGFQFSYLAVFGILYFQPKLTRLWLPGNYFIDKIWQLITVSIAVQITTFPLALFYFHQFPTYFWLTNIIIIPIVWLVMLGSMLLFMFLSLSFFSNTIAFVLDLLLKIQNSVVQHVNHFPLSCLTTISYSVVQLITYFSFLFLFLFALENKKYKNGIWYILGFLIVTQSYHLMVFELQEKQHEIVIYNDHNKDIVSLIKGHMHKLLCFTDDSVSKQKLLADHRDFWTELGIASSMEIIPIGHEIKTHGMLTFSIPWMNRCSLFLLHGNQITLVSSGNHVKKRKNFLFIGEDAGFPNEVALDTNLADELILGASVPSYENNAWKKYARRHKIPCYDIRTSGAFLFLLNEN